MKLSSIKADPVLEEQGAWVDEIPGMDDLALKVRPIPNADYRAMNNKLTMAVPRAKRTGADIIQSEKDRIQAILFARTVLLDWNNLQDENGPIPYSREKALALLNDPEYREALSTAILYAGMTVIGDRQADTEEAVKN